MTGIRAHGGLISPSSHNSSVGFSDPVPFPMLLDASSTAHPACDSQAHLPHIRAGAPTLASEYDKLVKVKWSGRVVEEGRRQGGK